jgi:hypothetical protein
MYHPRACIRKIALQKEGGVFAGKPALKKFRLAGLRATPFGDEFEEYDGDGKSSRGYYSIC